MNEGWMQPELRIVIDKATAYTISKGRMPKDVHELREWLREFAEFEMKCYEAVETAYREHLNSCTRPIIVPVRRPPNPEDPHA